MCQFVAISKHLFKCRYECQNFGFWGAFLAGRFCVYITQMNFHFYRFSSFSFFFISFVLPPFLVCFLLCSFTAFLLFLPCLILSCFTAFPFFSCSFLVLFFCLFDSFVLIRSFVPDSFALSVCLWVKYYS